MYRRIVKPYLEYSVSDSCTLKCEHCSHFSPFLKTYFPSVESYERDVKVLSKYLQIDILRLLGGEPFMNKNLAEFVSIGKTYGLGKRIGVCTNGSLYKMEFDDVYRNINFLDVTIYPGVNFDTFEAIEFFTEKSKEFGFTLRVNNTDRFYEINIDIEISDERARQVWKSCDIAHKWQCMIFREGYLYKCAKPVHQNKYFKHRGIETDIDYTKVDGCSLHDDDLERRLPAYINRTDPLESCKYCLGVSGSRPAHRQLSKEEL